MVERKESDNTERKKKSMRLYEPIFYGKVILWFVIQMIYTFLGGLLFVLLEECYGIDETPSNNYKHLISYVESHADFGEEEKIKFKNISEQYLKTLLKERKCELNHDAVAKWWSFTIVTCYTIGKINHLF